MTQLLSHLIVGYLVFILPWLGRWRYLQLKKQVAAGVSDAKLSYYRRMLLQQAVLSIAIAGIWLLDDVPRRALGLVAPSSWKTALTSLAVLLLAVVVSIVLFRHKGDRQLKRVLQMAGAVLPVSPAERRWFAVVSVGAGLSEELVCRGFLLYYLVATWSLDWTSAILLSSMIFGFCHLYQGWKGVLGTTLFGGCFALLYIGAGSLLVPMIVHAAVDLRLLLILTPRRLQSLQAAPDPALAASATR